MLYEGLRTMGYKDMGDLVDKVDELAEEWRQSEGDQDE